MAPRAQWKGFLKFGEVTCPVALYTAASTSERIAFNTINRATGNRVRREFVDSETGKPVEKEDQVKGYEVTKGDYILLEPEEVAAAVPESDKTLDIQAFLQRSQVDDVFFDKPYYLAPSDRIGEEAFALIREGMKKKNVVAIAQTVLFRRVRTVLIRPEGNGLIATTLNFDYEVRSAEEAFGDVPKMKIKGEMLDLAKHIINTKVGEFDPASFNDRYEAAVAELVKAKMEGRKITPRKEPKREKVTNLLDALRESAGLVAGENQAAVGAGGPRQKTARASGTRGKAAAAQQRKAG
ncbi:MULTISPECIES: Ku protein [unclassified Sinorhizobium]|uniref:non-homologous end joining protein Ku n=1 Tax=unclassified Sinorhizobium TaxID=2613772 RepID=UPI0035251088